MEITIQDKTYKIKYSIRALFIFEQLTGKSFSLDSLMNQYVFYYSMILANNPECTLTFESFIDSCDENPTIMIDFQSYISEVFAKQAQLVKSEEDSKKK